MKEITVENFNYLNVKEWIADYSHREKVKFAVYCAELVIDLYIGTSEAPKKAIQAAKDWILNPSESNKKKCKDAAADADAADADADADDATAAYAAFAAYAAAYAAADAATSVYTATVYAATAAYAADVAAADKRSNKDKIISYINNKLTPQAKEVEWENGDILEYKDEGDEWSTVGRYVCFDTFANHHVFYAANMNLYHAGDEQIRKPETPGDKKESEDLEGAYHLYQMNNRIKSFSTVSFEEFKNKLPKRLEAWLAIVKETGYRVEK